MGVISDLSSRSSSFLQFYEQLAQFVTVDIADHVDEEAWESRLEIALHEWRRGASVEPSFFLWNGKLVCLYTDSPELFALPQSTESIPKNRSPWARVFFLGKIDDLATLRRLKEYPDETPTEELLASWVGVCKSAQTLVWVRPQVLSSVIPL